MQLNLDMLIITISLDDCYSYLIKMTQQQKFQRSVERQTIISIVSYLVVILGAFVVMAFV